MRIKLSRKEAIESAYWLELVHTDRAQYLEEEKDTLKREATELMKIFGAILRKSEVHSK